MPCTDEVEYGSGGMNWYWNTHRVVFRLIIIHSSSNHDCPMIDIADLLFQLYLASHSDIGCRRCFNTHFRVMQSLCAHFRCCKVSAPTSVMQGLCTHLRCCRASVPFSGYAKPLHPFPVLQGSLHPLSVMQGLCTYLRCCRGVCTHSDVVGHSASDTRVDRAWVLLY